MLCTTCMIYFLRVLMDCKRNQTNENVLLNWSNQCKYFSLFSKVTTLIPSLCSILFQPCFLTNTEQKKKKKTNCRLFYFCRVKRIQPCEFLFLASFLLFLRIWKKWLQCTDLQQFLKVPRSFLLESKWAVTVKWCFWWENKAAVTVDLLKMCFPFSFCISLAMCCIIYSS